MNEQNDFMSMTSNELWLSIFEDTLNGQHFPLWEDNNEVSKVGEAVTASGADEPTAKN